MVLFVSGILSDLSVVIKQVTVSVAIIQLEVFGASMQVTVPAGKMWFKISVAIMQVVLTAVHYAHNCFHCNYAGKSFFYSYVVPVSSNFLFLTDSLFS